MAPIPALDPAGFAACLAPAAAADALRRRIPDAFLVLAAGLLLLIRALQGSLRAGQFLGAASGFLFFLSLWAATRGRLGFGDVKLAGVVGFLVGVPGLLVAFLLAAAGGIAGLALRRLLCRVPWKESLPFAPFLAAGGLAAWYLAGPLEGLL